MLCDVQILGEFPSRRFADFVDIADSYGWEGNIPYGIVRGVHCGHCRRVEVLLPNIQDYKNNSPSGEQLNYYPQ
jgi:hypothetical protein